MYFRTKLSQFFQPFSLCGVNARANFRSVLIYFFLAEDLEINLSFISQKDSTFQT